VGFPASTTTVAVISTAVEMVSNAWAVSLVSFRFLETSQTASCWSLSGAKILSVALTVPRDAMVC
jgi:hypothetical protein